MAYSALEIAKYMISYCVHQKRPISNLKLQKMLYYAWIDYYKETGKELFFDRIFAWQLGPVVPETYYEFCSYAGKPITKEYTIELDNTDKTIIDLIIEKYIPITAGVLVSRTHEKGKPWDIIYKEGYGDRDEIPFDLIKLKECA